MPRGAPVRHPPRLLGWLWGLLGAGWSLDQREAKPSLAFAGRHQQPWGSSQREAWAPGVDLPFRGPQILGPLGAMCGCGRCCPFFLPPPPSFGHGVRWEDPSSPWEVDTPCPLAGVQVWLVPVQGAPGDLEPGIRVGVWGWAPSESSPGSLSAAGPSRSPVCLCAAAPGLRGDCPCSAVPRASPCHSPCRRHVEP